MGNDFAQDNDTIKKFGTTMLYIRQKIPMMVFVLQLVKKTEIARIHRGIKGVPGSTDKWSCFGFV